MSNAARKPTRNPARYLSRQPGVQYGALDDLIGYTIRRAQLVVTETFDRSFAGIDLTTQRFSALVLIKENPGLKQTELARIMGIARSGALAIVSALIRDGLVVQLASGTDRRACELHLTPLGKRKIPRIIARVKAHDKEITQGLTDSEKRLLVELLAKVQIHR